MIIARMNTDQGGALRQGSETVCERPTHRPSKTDWQTLRREAGPTLHRGVTGPHLSTPKGEPALRGPVLLT
jgi:hypothetical protein